MQHSRAPVICTGPPPTNRLVGLDRYQHLGFHAGKFVCIPLLIARIARNHCVEWRNIVRMCEQGLQPWDNSISVGLFIFYRTEWGMRTLVWWGECASRTCCVFSCCWHVSFQGTRRELKDCIIITRSSIESMEGLHFHFCVFPFPVYQRGNKVAVSR